jgi:hypothetical protein
MPENETEAARERRALRSRADRMKRAAAGVYLSIGDLPPLDRTIVLLEALQEENNRARQSDVGAVRRCMVTAAASAF